MNIEHRLANLEKKMSLIVKEKSKPTHYEVKLLASNDHAELELKISTWLRKAQPTIIDTKFVADGAEYTYCAMFIFEKRSRPLPKDNRK